MQYVVAHYNLASTTVFYVGNYVGSSTCRHDARREVETEK